MVDRTLAATLRDRAASYPVVFLTGPRQSGKTTIARATFPDFNYYSLERLNLRQRIEDDPLGFLQSLEGCPGAVIDEAQYVPDLFSYLLRFVDEGRSGPLVRCKPKVS